MSIGNLFSSGYISFLEYDTDPLIPHFTTTSEDETILFKDGTEQRYLNALFIENTGDAVMYVRLLPSDYILVIPAQESRTYDMTKTNGIQIMGNTSQTLRWSGCYY